MENEKRLIDANDALEVLCGCCDVEGCCPPGKCYEYQKISKLPTVDAVKVVHGRWKRVKVDLGSGMKTHRFACSECDFLKNTLIGKYCPNCGAKMDGDGDG